MEARNPKICFSDDKLIVKQVIRHLAFIIYHYTGVSSS